MSKGSVIKVEGLDQALKNIDALDQKMKGKTLRKSLMFASKPMLGKAKQSIHSYIGTLKKSIKRSSKLYKKKTVIILKLGIKSDATLGKHNPAIYGPMHEEGSVSTSNQGFLRKAFDSEWMQTITKFKDKLAGEILEAVKKLPK